jgi:rubrerythrin
MNKARSFYMDSEQAKTLKALQFAIQMEIDGKKYYQEASRNCSITAGRNFFEWLSEQEEWHLQKFEQIYKSIQDNKGWPAIDISAGRKGNMETFFSKEGKSVSCKLEIAATELDTIAKAMEMENKTRDYYIKQGEDSTNNVEGQFYKALAAEEQKHYLALVDYREYLQDTDGWFTRTEHHSMDGG